MKPSSSQSEKLYTFMVSVSFDMQFTFTEEELGPAEEGNEDDLVLSISEMGHFLNRRLLGS